MTDPNRMKRAEERLQVLETELRELQSRHNLAEDGNERSDGHHHPAEAASDSEMREHDLRLQSRARERMGQIERALKSIADGTYGVCVECGTPIPDGRLQIKPDAERCVPCQTRADRYR